MKIFKVATLLAALTVALCACSCSVQETPNPSASMAPIVTPNATVTPDITNKPSQSPEQSPSASPNGGDNNEGQTGQNGGNNNEGQAGQNGGNNNGQNNQTLRFTPGKYQGEGEGMNGKVVIEMEFSEDKIVSLELVQHSETEGIYEKAYDTLSKEIVEKQSLNVDTVAGATYTSNAIIHAAEDCVNKAGGDIGLLKS